MLILSVILYKSSDISYNLTIAINKKEGLNPIQQSLIEALMVTSPFIIQTLSN